MNNPTTLYKLMILYMLNKVNFPLSNSQITEFMVAKEYTTYFTVQEVLNSLTQDNFVHELAFPTNTQYKLTAEGLEAIKSLDNMISSAIKDDIDTYLKLNKYDLRCEAGTTADYYKTNNGDYIVSCKVKEGDTTLIELNIAVPIESQANAMCLKWKDACQDIYDYVIHKML